MQIERFDSWCRTVILNSCRQYANKRSKLWKAEVKIQEDEGWYDKYFVRKMTVYGFEIETAEGELLEQMQRLKRNQQVSVYLYYYLGFTDKEAGTIMGIPKSTAHWTRHKALDNLRIGLGGKYAESRHRK